VAGVYVLIALALMLLALIPAKIAADKGRSFLEWYLFGIIFFIAALPAAVLARDERAVCPLCRETVKDEAVVCPHCQREIEPEIPDRPVRGDQRYVGVLDDLRDERRRR